MQTALVKPARNQSMECCKMLAAVLVVLIHVEFPGRLNAVALGLTEFAVPMFFAISGFFNYQADCRTIARRLRHILGLFFLANGIHLVVMFALNCWEGRSLMDYIYAALPDLDEVPKLLLAQQSLLLAQSWTLLSTALAYCVLWCYTRFSLEGKQEIDYSWLYMSGLVLFCVYFANGIVLGGLGVTVPYHAYRNGWFLGIPCFLLGMFFHQYYERICSTLCLTTGRLAALTVCSGLMCVAQYLLKWPGKSIGVLIQVPALMLLLIGHPQIVQPEKHKWLYKLVSKLGILSTGVYILHITVRLIYQSVLQEALTLKLGELEPWLRPLTILALSILAAILYERAACFWKRRKQKTAA